MDKIKVEIERDLANELIKLKQVGDTYSDVIKKSLHGDLMMVVHRNYDETLSDDIEDMTYISFDGNKKLCKACSIESIHISIELIKALVGNNELICAEIDKIIGGRLT